jgi:hypothetical protein
MLPLIQQNSARLKELHARMKETTKSRSKSQIASDLRRAINKANFDPLRSKLDAARVRAGKAALH